MDIPSTTIIIVGGICLVLGYFTSVLLNTLRDDYEPEQPDNPHPPGGLKGKYKLITRLWRDQKSGALLVEVDGKSLTGSQPLTETQRSELEQAERDFRSWLGMGLAAAQQPGRAQIASTGPTPVTSEQPISSLTAQPHVGAGASTSVRSQGNDRPLQPDATSKAENSAAPAADSTPAGKSIVMQIEDVLQDLTSDGPYADRVHLSEDPARGVIVHIDDQQFVGIDSVTDPEIKSILRSAVSAWEKM